MVEDILIRRADIQDAELYFNWANDEEVRSNSFNQNVIVKKEHENWFKHKIQTNKTYLLVFEVEKEPRGQIRFDLNSSGIWEIDYSIDKKFRGLGYGGKIVSEGIKFLNKNEANPEIIAKVKRQNTASIKVFKKLGFQESHEQNYIQFRYK